MSNPITREIREIRHQLAGQFDNDLGRIFEDLKCKEAELGVETIDLSHNADNTESLTSHGTESDRDEGVR